MISQRAEFEMKKVKPVFTLKSPSEYHLISHNSITAELNIKVTRMKDMITNQWSFWLFNKFSLLAP